MKAILRQIGLLVLYFAGIYLLIITVSFSQSRTQNVDIMPLEGSINDSFRRLTLDTCRLQRSNKPKLIILGGSSTAMGFRPEYLRSLFPEYEIANLAIPAATAEEVRQTMEMVQTLVPKDILHKSFLVVGILYHTLMATPLEGGPRVNRFLVGSGLYKWDGAGVRPVVPANRMDLLVNLLRPYFSLQFALERNGLEIGVHEEKPISFFVKAMRGKTTTSNLEMPLVDAVVKLRCRTDEEKQKVVALISQRCDMESEAGYKEILTMCRLVQERESNLVLVDVPIAEWHKRLSPAHKSYQQHKEKYIKEALQYTNVRYINLQDVDELSSEPLFTDGVHANELAAKEWCRALKDRWDEKGSSVFSHSP